MIIGPFLIILRMFRFSFWECLISHYFENISHYFENVSFLIILRMLFLIILRVSHYFKKVSHYFEILSNFKNFLNNDLQDPVFLITRLSFHLFIYFYWWTSILFFCWLQAPDTSFTCGSQYQLFIFGLKFSFLKAAEPQDPGNCCRSSLSLTQIGKLCFWESLFKKCTIF